MSARASTNGASLAHLHAALDSIDELRALLEAVHVPFQAAVRARRLGLLASEMRDIVIELLRPVAG